MANTHEEKGWGEGERGEVSPRAPDLEASRLGSAKSKWGTGSTLMIWSTVRTLLPLPKAIASVSETPSEGADLPAVLGPLAFPSRLWFLEAAFCLCAGAGPGFERLDLVLLPPAAQRVSTLSPTPLPDEPALDTGDRPLD